MWVEKLFRCKFKPLYQLAFFYSNLKVSYNFNEKAKKEIVDNFLTGWVQIIFAPSLRILRRWAAVDYDGKPGFGHHVEHLDPGLFSP